MAKIKISKEEVRQMIKEEYFKKLTEIKLKNRLHQINEEIKSIVSEEMEEGLEEVTAGGKDKVRSTGWTGEKGGDEKWQPKFEKKGSHLVEDDETKNGEVIGDEMPAGDEIPAGDEMPAAGDEEITIGDEEGIEGDLDIEAILAKLADAIEDKIETTVDEKLGGETSEVPGEDKEEIEVDKTDLEVAPETAPEELDEQDGTSVAQEQKPKDAVPFDNGKADIPKADQLVSESTMKRMQILSGIRKNDFHD
jgi:hypothetical protein